MAEKSKSQEKGSLQQLDERLLELSALFEISRSLASSLSIHSILQNILRIPMGHMLISRGLVLLKNEATGEFVVEDLKGLSRNLIGKTMRIEDPPHHSVLIQQMKNKDKWVEFFEQFGLELLLPLNSSKGTIGIVGFGEKIGGVSFQERELEFLDSLSNIAASAVNNGIMVEEIQRVNRSLDRKIQQLNTIFDISRELNTTLDKKKIASLLSFAVMGELLVNKCMVLIREEKGMEVLVSKGIEPLVLEDLCGLAEPLILQSGTRFQEYKDVGVEILVPMRIQDETKGILAVGPKISGAAFDEADQEFLKTLGNQAMTSLENARMFEDTLEKQRMEEELNLARSIQQGLLPSQLPRLERFEIAAKNISSREVGGDYFDVIAIDKNRLGIAIADVSGKGAGAALLMANLQATLQALVPTGIELNNMVVRINELIFRNTAMDKFITFFFGILDLEDRTFTYCNAGHNPPYRVSRGGDVEELMTGGIILGMLQNMAYQTETVPLNSGDRIVMYTDGITEARDTEDQEYGEDRLKAVILKEPGISAEELLEAIQKDVEEFSGEAPQADDITMVVLRVL